MSSTVQDTRQDMTEIDRIPLSQLPLRYGIARSALYTRLKDLQIEPVKEGKKAYVDGSQLQLLDELHEHIQQGGTTNEFLKQKASKSTGLSRTDDRTQESSLIVQDSPGQITLQPSGLVSVVEAIVKRLLPKTGGRLSYLRELEEACEKGWLLSTSELADLLGLSAKTIAAYGQHFEDAGFVFTRAGTRTGGEIAWAIDKGYEVEGLPQQSGIGVKEAFSTEFDPEPE
jgi:DNA-binding Lrp family transcriptional regulator